MKDSDTNNQAKKNGVRSRVMVDNSKKRYAYGSGPEMVLKDSKDKYISTPKKRKACKGIWSVVIYLLNPLSIWSSAKRQMKQENLARRMKRNRL